MLKLFLYFTLLTSYVEEQEWRKYCNQTAEVESKGRYNITSPCYTYWGRYQLYHGYINPQIKSRFLKDSLIQEKEMLEYTLRNFEYIKDSTNLGYKLAACHSIGISSLSFLNSYSVQNRVRPVRPELLNNRLLWNYLMKKKDASKLHLTDVFQTKDYLNSKLVVSIIPRSMTMKLDYSSLQTTKLSIQRDVSNWTEYSFLNILKTKLILFPLIIPPLMPFSMLGKLE